MKWPDGNVLFEANNDTLTQAVARPMMEAWFNCTRMLPGAQPFQPLSIRDNNLAPQYPDILVDTEGGAPVDDLVTIDTANIYDGAMLNLRAAGKDRKVTLKHAYALNGIRLSGEADIELSTNESVTLKRFGDHWEEVGSVNKQSALFYLGEHRLFPFRPDELPEGWHFMNGDTHPLASPLGQALNNLSAQYKTDWRIAVNGDNEINVPNYFELGERGYHQRAVDSVNRAVGSVQQDEIKEHTHAYTKPLVRPNMQTSTANAAVSMEAAQTLPTGGPENLVLNVGLTPAIYLGV